jgi:hypothetical protein
MQFPAKKRVRSWPVGLSQVAEIAALVGNLAPFSPSSRAEDLPLLGLALLGLSTGGLGWSLVGDADVRYLRRPAGLALV